MNKESIINYAKELGRKGGKASAKSRFNGKSKAEISEFMRNVRKSYQGYTIKERTFEATAETDPEKKAKLNADTLTSEGCPEHKYQLVALHTEFVFRTLEECHEQLRKLDIPVRKS